MLTCQSPAGFSSCAGLTAQDGSQGRDAIAAVGLLSKTGGGVAGFDFSKIDATGNPLTIQNAAWKTMGSEALGTRWSCIKDNHTGLIWEMKQEEETSPNFLGRRFTWYNSKSNENGEDEGVKGETPCGAGLCDTESFAAAMNAQKLCGMSNWRLPTISELTSIVWGDRPSMAIDINYFPTTLARQYWTSQTYAPERNYAWYSYFGDGSLGRQQKSSQFLVRLVADTQVTP